MFISCRKIRDFNQQRNFFRVMIYHEALVLKIRYYPAHSGVFTELLLPLMFAVVRKESYVLRGCKKWKTFRREYSVR